MSHEWAAFKTATASASDIAHFVKSEQERNREDLEAIEARETVWELYGTNTDGSSFDAKLTVYGSGAYELVEDAVPGMRMSRVLVRSTDPNKLGRALADIQDLSWNLLSSG